MSDLISAPDEGLTAGEIAARARELRERVAQAAAHAGRASGDITLVCVSKTHPASVVQAAYQAGLRDFGENYVQEAVAKQDELSRDVGRLPGEERLRWHLIGHLQSNKTNQAAGRFGLIHTVDSLKLGERIGRAAEAVGGTQEILIQIKLGGEVTKNGIAPEEAVRLAEELARFPGVRVRGLMAIAPLAAEGLPIPDPRPYFAQAKRTFDALPQECRHVLSMGMSSDFEAAVEEGSTLIRVGTHLLGRREPKPSLLGGEQA